jgi:hypothetical protein
MRLTLSWLVAIALLGMILNLPGFAEAPLGGAAIHHNESMNGSIFTNSSGLQAKEHIVTSQSPKIITIGMGYYAAHPINYSSQFGQKTWLINRATGTSMNNEVNSAHDLNQTLAMSAQDTHQQDESGIRGSSGLQMKVTEDVQEGKVSIGVLQGGTPGMGMTPSATALRNPSMDIEEDYIGSFHIEKNMSIQVPFGQIWQNYSWLPCCNGGYFDVPEFNRKNLDAGRIFDSTNGI